MSLLGEICDWLEEKLNSKKTTDGPATVFPSIHKSIKEVVSDVKDNSFYEKGNKILINNGWEKKGSSYEHHSYPFRISNCLGGYEISHKQSGYKTIKIVKVENILKGIKEYNVYLKAKHTRITKESFMKDFE